MTTDLQLLSLKRPMDLKWRVQRAFPNKDNPTHVIMVAYTDSRDIQDRLDECVGMGNWQTRYFECKGKQFCEIGIKIGGDWVWKGDNGTESQTEKQKGETSDSFKRAAVHWGINRYAYKVGEVKIPCKPYSGKPYPCDNTGKFIKGKELFKMCNTLGKVDDFDVEFDNMFNSFKSDDIPLEELTELFELKKEGLDPIMLPDAERIISNKETASYHKLFKLLQSC